MGLYSQAWYVQGATGVVQCDLGSAGQGAGPATVTLAITVPAGALIVVAVNEATATVAGSLSDSVNGAYTIGPSGVWSGSAGFGAIYYFANSAALTSATLTFTKNASSHAAVISAFYLTGMATSGVYDSAMAATSAANTATPSVTSGTPTQANNVVVAALAYTTGSFTQSPAFFAPFSTASAGAAFLNGGHYSVAGTLPVTFAPTLSVSSNSIIMIAGFKIAGTPIGWWAITRWLPSTSKVCGDVVRQNSPPVGSVFSTNERAFVCVNSTGGTGQTGASEPAWSIGQGTKTTDNTVTWIEATGGAALNGDLTNTFLWSQLKILAPATLGQVLKSSDGSKILICTTAGALGASEPTWAAYTTAGATTVDNAATWTTLKAVPPGYGAWATPIPRLQTPFGLNWIASTSLTQSIYVWVAANHADVYMAPGNLTHNPGFTTYTTPGYITCGDHTTGAPPTAITTGASIKFPSGSIQIQGFQMIEWNGIDFQVGAFGYAGTTSTNFIFHGSSSGYSRFVNCVFRKLGNLAAVHVWGASGNAIEFVNTQIQQGLAGDKISLTATKFIWKNTANAVVGSALPTNLFQFTGTCPSVVLDGVDLSMLGAGKTLFSQSGANISYSAMLKNCALGSGVTVAATPTGYECNVEVVDSDSGATNYRNERYQYQATKTTETSIVRTGGSSDGTTPFSWKISTTANANWLKPFEDSSLAVWVDTTGSSKTITLYGTLNAGAVPKNDEVWMEVYYQGSSGNPNDSFATTGKANYVATGSSLTADSSAWGGGGSGAGWSPFRTTATITTQMKGYVYGHIKVAKPSTTYYVDPLLDVA